MHKNKAQIVQESIKDHSASKALRWPLDHGRNRLQASGVVFENLDYLIKELWNGKFSSKNMYKFC